MPMLRRFAAGFRSLFRKQREEWDLSEEMGGYIEAAAEEKMRDGLSREEATRAARAEAGSATAVRDQVSEAGWESAFAAIWQDLRYALRLLRKSPGFTIVAILTLALGIGATTAIFSVVDAALLHPLPYPHAEQLVALQDDLPGVGARDVGLSTPEWWDLERSGVFEYVSPVWFDDNNLTGSSQPARVRLMSVAVNYFALLGVKPQLGSTFDPHDPTPGYNLQVVISDGLWKRAFAADPEIVGQTVWADTDPYRVIGVMPPGFHAPGRTPEERNVEVWAAMGFAATPLSTFRQRNKHIPGAIARLKPGLTLADAQRRIDALVASLQKQYPVDYPERLAWTIRLVPLRDTVVGNIRWSLYFLLGAVGLVLLIACVNIANLLLARASARGREMAIRQALGARRARLTRQLLTESLFLSLLGGLIGLLILFFTREFLLQLVPESLPRLSEISINWEVLLFALGASLLAGTFFGLAPALHAGRLDLMHTLKQEGRGSAGSRAQARTRRLLVVTEFALSLILMIAASLLLRSFWDVLKVRPGFDHQGVTMIRTRLPYPNDPTTDIYGTSAQEAPFLREVLRRCRALPGVQEAALGNSTSVPFDHHHKDQNQFPLIIEGRSTPSDDVSWVDGTVVTPEYFHLLRMTLLRGRLFTDSDHEKAPPVAVINEAMARNFWPKEDPLGQHVKLSRKPGDWITVVGVVADTRADSLENEGTPQIYASLYQKGEKHLAIFLRGNPDPAQISAQVRTQVHAVNPDLPVFGAETLTDALADSLAVRRFLLETIGLFALAALFLAGLGIYGVISYLVSERTHEIGIHLALGAQRGHIMQMVLRQGLGLAMAGAAAGLVGGLIVSQAIGGLLYGVRPTDPLTFIAVTAVLTFVALAACFIPARRATRVDPMIALRAS